MTKVHKHPLAVSKKEKKENKKTVGQRKKSSNKIIGDTVLDWFA